MPFKLEFNADPTLQRVATIGTLLMLEAIFISLGVIFSQQRMPTDYELGAIITTAAMQLVTFIMAFLKKEEAKEPS